MHKIARHLRLAAFEIRHRRLVFLENVKDYGIVRGALLDVFLFQAREVIRRVRTHVLGDGVAQVKEAVILKESYSGSLNMIAVAVRNPSRHSRELLLIGR